MRRLLDSAYRHRHLLLLIYGVAFLTACFSIWYPVHMNPSWVFGGLFTVLPPARVRGFGEGLFERSPLFQTIWAAFFTLVLCIGPVSFIRYHKDLPTFAQRLVLTLILAFAIWPITSLLIPPGLWHHWHTEAVPPGTQALDYHGYGETVHWTFLVELAIALVIAAAAVTLLVPSNVTVDGALQILVIGVLAGVAIAAINFAAFIVFTQIFWSSWPLPYRDYDMTNYGHGHTAAGLAWLLTAGAFITLLYQRPHHPTHIAEACPKCGYDLRGSFGPDCPECGAIFWGNP